MTRIALAYSGGLRSSIALRWLTEQPDAEVITVTVDVGQSRDLEAVRNRAIALGAARAHVLDGCQELACDYVMPALKADATAEDRCPMVTALAWPLVASKLVDIARIEQAGVLAHGAIESGGRTSPLGAALAALDPEATVLAPSHDAGVSRREQLAYCHEHGISTPAGHATWAAESTVWGRDIELDTSEEEPAIERSAPFWTLSKSREESRAEPAYVELDFERGAPVAVNGITMSFLDLIASVNTIAGAHGVGRRVAGHRLCEAPAAVVLHAAHQLLQQARTSESVLRLARCLSREYAALVAGGLWFSPLRGVLDAAVERIQDSVNGSIRLKLFKGSCELHDNALVRTV